MEIVLDVEKINNVISSIDTKVEQLKEINNEMNTKIDNTFNSSNYWNSAVKDKMYEYYLNTSKIFEDNINKLESLKVFLENTRDSYVEGDNSINEDILNNKDQLSLN